MPTPTRDTLPTSPGSGSEQPAANEQDAATREIQVVKAAFRGCLRHLSQREIASKLQIGTGAGISLMIKRARFEDDFARWKNGLELLFKG